MAQKFCLLPAQIIGYLTFFPYFLNKKFFWGVFFSLKIIATKTHYE
jgi:hypothetical protein